MIFFLNLSYKSRKLKHELFYNTFHPNEKTKILDLGGQIDDGNNGGLQFIDSFAWKHNISVINITPAYIDAIKKKYPEIDAVIGDACALPWPENHFDIVFSNAVIEHLGSYDNQMKMASEIMRVGKQWFITTPNRWFPFEFHMRLPFVTWCPRRFHTFIGKVFSYNHGDKKYRKGNDFSDLRLLSKNDMQSFFPKSKIYKQRITFWPETIIAVGEKEIQ